MVSRPSLETATLRPGEPPGGDDGSNHWYKKKLKLKQHENFWVGALAKNYPKTVKMAKSGISLAY